jgi:phosphoglycerate dehydrogenase-like enzyme
VTADCGAEHILGMMLAFAHGFPHFRARQRERVWDRQPALPKMLAGQTLSILGFGAYGSALARRAKALDMRVLAIRRSAAHATYCVDELWAPDRLDDLIAQADHLVINLPLTAATRRLIGAEQLHRMRPHAYLYNTSRGDIVDETALLAALRNGTIAGAGLDVFSEEPLSRDSPFWELPNVMITPHVAGCWAGKWDAAFDFFCENLERYVAGRPLRNIANFERGY